MLVDQAFAIFKEVLKVRKLSFVVFVFSSKLLNKSKLTIVSTIVFKEVGCKRCVCAQNYYYVLRPLFN